MKSKLITIVIVYLAAMVGASTTLAQSTLSIPSNPAGPSPIGGLVCPSGDGDAVNEAWLLSTYVVETITARLMDGPDPIPNFPFEDMWLEFDGFCNCFGIGDDVYADFNTDEEGYTTFTAPLSAGSCHSIPEIRFVVSGTVLVTQQYNLNVQFASVDYDCDGDVDADDQAEFIVRFWQCQCGSLDYNPACLVPDVQIMAVHRFGSPAHVWPPIPCN